MTSSNPTIQYTLSNYTDTISRCGIAGLAIFGEWYSRQPTKVGRFETALSRDGLALTLDAHGLRHAIGAFFSREFVAKKGISKKVAEFNGSYAADLMGPGPGSVFLSNLRKVFWRGAPSRPVTTQGQPPLQRVLWPTTDTNWFDWFTTQSRTITGPLSYGIREAFSQESPHKIPLQEVLLRIFAPLVTPVWNCHTYNERHKNERGIDPNGWVSVVVVPDIFRLGAFVRATRARWAAERDLAAKDFRARYHAGSAAAAGVSSLAHLVAARSGIPSSVVAIEAIGLNPDSKNPERQSSVVIGNTAPTRQEWQRIQSMCRGYEMRARIWENYMTGRAWYFNLAKRFSNPLTWKDYPAY